MIRRANEGDIKRIVELLHQVNMVHHVLRPDLFKPHTTKYSEQELSLLLEDGSKPIFIYDDGTVLGYAFCQVSEIRDNQLLEDIKTLYIDDICVDENARGKHIGKSLYEYVRNYAQSNVITSPSTYGKAMMPHTVSIRTWVCKCRKPLWK